MSYHRAHSKLSQSEMDTEFPEDPRDTRTSFWEPLHRRTTSSSLSGSLVTSLAAKGSRWRPVLFEVLSN